MIKKIIKEICPPFLMNYFVKSRLKKQAERKVNNKAGLQQELDLYWDPEMAQALESWGEDNAWVEIKLIMLGMEGRVLDIACGTGKVMEILKDFSSLTIDGCDISDFLLDKAVSRGISRQNLTRCDATNMPYKDGDYDYSYSIGSLEHFTEKGISDLFKECKRTVKKMSFHMIPVSKSGQNEGWIQPYQSYFNNSSEWWVEKAQPFFKNVNVIQSSWTDQRSNGIWLICEH